MVLSKINIIKIISFVFIFLFLLLNTFKANIKTALTDAILSKDYLENSSITEIANKSSESFNVIIENKSEDEIIDIKNDFINKYDKNIFEITSFDTKKLQDFYTKSPTNFLSFKTKENLKNKNYDKIFENAVYNLYNPTGFNLVPFEDDPYFLFNDFIINNFNGFNDIKEKDGKYYSIINLRVKNNKNISAKQIEKSMENLLKTNKNLKFSGSFVHSYLTTQKTKLCINLVCVFSALIFVCLIYFYFKSFIPLFLIATSIIFGFLAGFCAVKSIFNEIHLMTLLFATTLIGIGIDYSFHYLFNEKLNKNFIKNLTYSYLTTAAAFLILYFSKIKLIEQISVFMIFGLLAVCLFVIFIMPCFELKYEIKKIELKLSNKLKKIFLIFLIIITFTGLFKIKFDDSLLSIYSPEKNLKQNDMLYNKITNEENYNIYFLINKANNIEELLQKEEKLNEQLEKKNIKYVSMSKFIPSKKLQSENISFVSELYSKNLKNFSEFLSNEQIKNILNKKHFPLEYKNINEDFDYFLLKNNKSMTVVYSKDILQMSDYCDEVLNIKDDISGNLKHHRITLLKLLCVVYFVLFFILVFIYGIKNGIKMYLPIIFAAIFALMSTLIFNIKINLFTVISLFLITGFTLDYSIFRLNGDKNSSYGIFASAFTTSISFLFLILAPLKLISSMSLVLFLGIVFSYILGQIFCETKN